MHNLELRRLNTCSFQTALDVWNEGFQGYFVDMTMSLDAFLARLATRGISPELSFIAFAGDQPVGFLVNGTRENAGRKFAWNGGTGVVPEFRGKGVGKVLVNAALDLYAKERVEIAMLEAISTNQPAIRLYESCGYEVVEELTFLETRKSIDNFVDPAAVSKYVLERVTPAVVGSLPFYRELSAWQGQWQSFAMTNGEAIIVVDSDRNSVGYALYEKKFDAQGKITRIALHQCEVAPNHSDAETVVSLALQNAFLTDPGECLRTTHNFRKSNSLVVDVLTKAGFITSIEQVHMIRTMSSVT